MTTHMPERIVSGRVVTVPMNDMIGELAGRMADHLLAGVLVRKSVDDPVPFSVWWDVADALRGAVQEPPGTAVAAVEHALESLSAAVDGMATPADAAVNGARTPTEREVYRATVLVARLLFSSAPTSPALLQARLARLRRCLHTQVATRPSSR
jgi:hypothetical protein